MSFEPDDETSDDDAIRAVLADGDPLARRTLRDALQRGGIAVVAEATTGTEAVDLVVFYRPDAVVMALTVPGLAGVEATRLISQRVPETCIVVLADDPEGPQALPAIQAGATGFLSRAIDPDVLPRAVRGALEGEAAISRRLSRELLESHRRVRDAGAGLRPVRSTLTDREWEVLDLVAAGAANDEIARTLVLSTETVRSHLKNLYRKLGVRSRGEAAAAARQLRELVS